MAVVHRYQTKLEWSGSTGVGYDAYDRSHEVEVIGPQVSLTLSADRAFRGDPASLNPEQLLVAAASSCQCLSFLAVAARARLDVVAYRDEARVLMPEDDRPVRITRIDLAPIVTLRAGPQSAPTEARLRRLMDLAHHECYVANSLSSEIVVSPSFCWLD